MKNRIIEAIFIALSVLSIIMHLLNLGKYPRIDIDPWGIYVILALILVSALNIALSARIDAMSILTFSGVMLVLMVLPLPDVFIPSLFIIPALIFIFLGIASWIQISSIRTKHKTSQAIPVSENKTS